MRDNFGLPAIWQTGRYYVAIIAYVFSRPSAAANRFSIVVYDSNYRFHFVSPRCETMIHYDDAVFLSSKIGYDVTGYNIHVIPIFWSKARTGERDKNNMITNWVKTYIDTAKDHIIRL